MYIDPERLWIYEPVDKDGFPPILRETGDPDFLTSFYNYISMQNKALALSIQWLPDLKDAILCVLLCVNDMLNAVLVVSRNCYTWIRALRQLITLSHGVIGRAPRACNKSPILIYIQAALAPSQRRHLGLYEHFLCIVMNIDFTFHCSQAFCMFEQISILLSRIPLDETLINLYSLHESFTFFLIITIFWFYEDFFFSLRKKSLLLKIGK